MTISELQKNVQKINIQKMFEQIIEEKEKEILEINKDQLEKGKNIKNQKIKPKYKNEPYAKKKQKLNPKAGFGTPDLKLSGEFQNLMFLKKKGKKYIPESKAKHFKYLKKYKDVLGWSDKGEKIRNDKIIYKEFMAMVRKEIGI